MALFGHDKDPSLTRQAGPATPNQINMVAEGTVFEGTLRTETDVRISGRIVGKLAVGGRAFVAPEGSIEGEVVAAHADIAGHVQGELLVEEHLVLRGSARIEGNIRTGRLIVEEGAVFNGECQMGQVGHLRKQAGAPLDAVLPKRADGPKEIRTRPIPPDFEGSDSARAAAL